MKKQRLILLAVLVIGALAVLAITNKKPAELSTTPYPTVEGAPTVVSATPKASGNIEVLIPRIGEEVKSGFSVRGNARVFENVVSIRLTDKEGNVLVQTTAYANAPDTGMFGPFEKVLEFETASKEGLLEVYQASPRDGSEIDKVSVPLVFE